MWVLQEDTIFKPWFLALSEHQCDFSAGPSHGGGKNYAGKRDWPEGEGLISQAVSSRRPPMARKTPRSAPTLFTTLLPLTEACPACGTPLLLDYYNSRTVTTLGGPSATPWPRPCPARPTNCVSSTTCARPAPP